MTLSETIEDVCQSTRQVDERPKTNREQTREAHFAEIAHLAAEATDSPAVLNRLIVEFLDTLCAVLHDYHPTIEPHECPFIGDTIELKFGPDCYYIASKRLDVLGSALASVIDNHDSRAEFDTSRLTGFPTLFSHIEAHLACGDSQDLTIPNELADAHWQAKELLNKFQRLHALGVRKTTGGLSKPTATGSKPGDSSIKPSVNGRMMAILADEQDEVVGWSAEKWAQILGCGASTVKGAPTWKIILARRAQSKEIRLASQASKIGAVGTCDPDRE